MSIIKIKELRESYEQQQQDDEAHQQQQASSITEDITNPNLNDQQLKQLEDTINKSKDDYETFKSMFDLKLNFNFDDLILKILSFFLFI